MLWEWANDPEVRRISFTGEAIPWERHCAWFSEQLQNSFVRMYIAVFEGVMVGQIRFDINGSEATVSISVAPSLRGKSYGSSIIMLGSEELFKTTQISLIHAFIKPSNERSVRAFVKAGYEAAGSTTVRGQSALDLVMRRP
jgi:RimJ/RimL family protein N-acetyltransferase